MQDYLTATNAHELFQKIVSELKQRDPQFGYAKIARLSGISSRSLPREVYTGRRALTMEFTESFVTGCKIPSAISQRLKLMVEFERNSNPLRQKALAQKLNKNHSLLKEQSLESQRKLNKDISSSKKNENIFLERNHFTNVFASLGSPGYGKSFDEIVKKSQTDSTQVQTILSLLLEKKILELKDSLYFLKQDHIDFNFSKALGPFQKYYIDRMRLAGEKAQNHFESKEMLFWEATVSISQKDLPALKEKLRSVLENFAAEIENGYGDSLVSLSAAFFDPRKPER